MFVLRTHKVPKTKRKKLRNLISWLNSNFTIYKRIEVHCYNKRILIHNNKCTFGLFMWNDKRQYTPRIYIATKESEISVLMTMVHEFCHYEQYRDRKEINHRGLDKRISYLLVRYLNEQTSL